MIALLSAVMVGDLLLFEAIAASVTVEGAWASFVPDLLVGLITTVGLGFVLFMLTRRIETSADARAARQVVLKEWRDAWLHLDEAIVITKEVRATLESLSDLHLGMQLAALPPARLAEWKAEVGGRELSLLVVAAHECRFVAELGRLIEERMAVLAVRGRIRNTNEPADVCRAVRAQLLDLTPQFSDLVGPSIAASTLADAEKIVADSVLQEYAPRYAIHLPRAQTAVANWQAVHYRTAMQTLNLEGQGTS